MTFAPSYSERKEWQRVRRFLVVGLSSTALDFLLLTILKRAGLSTLVANSLAFSIATVYNFIVSRAWTYAGTGRKQLGVQFGLFVITNLFGLILNDAIVLLLETPLGIALGAGAQSYLSAKVMATGAIAIWSYVTNRFWIFSEAH